MKRLSKLLLLKNHRDHPFARSWLADGDGLYGRTVSDSAQLGSMIRAEQFDVVLIDQRDSDDELIETIDGVRQHQQHSKLIVVSDTVALDQVVKAMRYNVRDIFQPPFSPAALAGRIERDLAEKAGGRARSEREALAHWSDVLASIEGPAAVNGHAAPVVVAGAARGAVHPVSSDNGAHQRTLDERTREIAELRLQLEKAITTQVALEAARARIEELEKSAAAAVRSSGAQEIAELRHEIEFHVGNAARLQEQLAMSTIGHAEMTREVARLGSIEVKLQRSESQLAALRVEAEARAGTLREAEAKLAHELERGAANDRAITAERERIAAREVDVAAQAAAAAQRQQETFQRQEQALKQLAHSLDERAAFIAGQAGRLAATGGEIDAGMAAVIRDAVELAGRIQALDQQRAVLRDQVSRIQTSATPA